MDLNKVLWVQFRRKPGNACGVKCHACGVEGRFSNFLWAGCAAARWCLGPPTGSLSRLLPHHNRDHAGGQVATEICWRSSPLDIANQCRLAHVCLKLVQPCEAECRRYICEASKQSSINLHSFSFTLFSRIHNTVASR